MALEMVNIPLPLDKFEHRKTVYAVLGKSITQELLREIFVYKGGYLYEKGAEEDLQELGWVNANGYRTLSILGKSYLIHRLIWCYCHGAMPTMDIDHIDHNRVNNHIENLREVTRLEQAHNVSLNKTSKTGIPGVRWHKHTQSYVATIGRYSLHKSGHLGCFKNLDEAVACRKAAEVAEGYHKNHGKPRQKG